MDGNLRIVRERKVLSREDLADASGATASTIYRIETSRTKKPHWQTLRKLARALAVPVEVLTSEQGDMGI